MIFVTVGTHRQQFDRLIDALTPLAGDELVVQHGHSRAPAQAAHAAAFMPFEEVQRWLARAEAAIVHAGVGSILCARRAGHVPIVVPRERRYGEHVDDHQVELAGALAGSGAVVVARDLDRLPELVRSAAPRGDDDGGGGGRLAAAVAAALR